MHYATCIGARMMNAAMDEKGGRLHRAITGNSVAGGIDGHDVRWYQVEPVDALRIDQELRVIQREAEMVADAFMQSEGRGRPERTSKIDLGLLHIHQYSPLMMFSSASPRAKRCA
jgi:hypothetical protein